MTRWIESRRPLLAMLGGVLWTVVLGLDDVAPAYVGVAAVVPVLLGFGVVEVYDRYDGRYGRPGRGGVVLSGSGLALLLVAVLLYAFLPDAFVKIFVVALPGVAGLVLLAAGSALLGYALRRLSVVPPVTAALLGLGIPLTPALGALLAAAAGATGLADGVVPSGVVTGVSGAAYGVGWILLGHRLRTTAAEHRDGSGTRSATDGTVTGPSVQVAAAGVVGATFLLLGAARVVPLGPLDGTPWVNGHVALDALHLLAGVGGVAVAASRGERDAHTYNRVVRVAFLALAGVTLVSMSGATGPWLRPWLAPLQLNLTDVVLYLPAGLLLAVVGVAVGDRDVSA